MKNGIAQTMNASFEYALKSLAILSGLCESSLKNFQICRTGYLLTT